MGADWRPHAPFLTAGPCLLAVPQVYKGVWRGSSVAIKTMVLPARMSGAEKRERMVSPALPPAPGMVLLRLCSGCLQLIGANTTVCMHCSPACQL